jgi:hypothetical protein
MTLTINESGSYENVSNPKIKLYAELMFGAFYNSGSFFVRPSYSKYALTKTICDDNTSNKCTSSGIDSGGAYARYGLIDFFNSGTWSQGWTKKIVDDWYIKNTWQTPPEFDVFNTCALESGNVFLTSYNNSPSPCADWRCNIIDEVKVPQTATATVTWLNSSFPSGFSTPQTFIMSLAENSQCYWNMNTRNTANTTGNSFGIKFSTISKGFCIFNCGGRMDTTAGYWTLAPFYTSPGAPGGDAYSDIYFSSNQASVSGLNIGKSNPSISGTTVMTRNIGLYLYGSGYGAGGSNILNVNGLTQTSGTLSIQFSDFYNIRDYI